MSEPSEFRSGEVAARISTNVNDLTPLLIGLLSRYLKADEQLFLATAQRKCAEMIDMAVEKEDEEGAMQSLREWRERSGIHWKVLQSVFACGKDYKVKR